MIFAWGLLFLLISCTPFDNRGEKSKTTVPIENSTILEKKEAELEEKSSADNIIGPSGCTPPERCHSYCLQNPFDCKAWCLLEEHKEICDRFGLVKEIPDGIPGAPCTKNDDCQTTLCLNFTCVIPSPEQMIKKSSFVLPGNCSSMDECATYCRKKENTLQCLQFCDRFPSICDQKGEVAVGKCKECVQCDARSCILDCTYDCYATISVIEDNIAALKQGVVFERKYQEPIKAVWEPGPAYNRYGMLYFVDDYKNMGVNTYSVTPKYTPEQGTLIHTVDHALGEKAKNEKIATIIRAKKAEMQVILVAHDLYDLFPDANTDKNEEIIAESYIDDIERTALEWANIAEEYNVEYFVPVNEFEYMLYENGYDAATACDITNKLYQKIIPKVKEVYNGKIYCRVGGMEGKFACMNFSQCDLFGFTYGFGGDNYHENFEKEFMVGEELAQKFNLPYIMAEAFSFNYDGVEKCKALHKAGIQAYKERAVHGKGYTFMGLIQSDPINKNDCPIYGALENKGVMGEEMRQEYKSFFAWMDGQQGKK